MVGCPGSGLPHWADRGAALCGVAQTHVVTGSHRPQPEQLECVVSYLETVAVTWGQLGGRDRGRTEPTVRENRDRAVAWVGRGDGAWEAEGRGRGACSYAAWEDQGQSRGGRGRKNT